MFEASSIGYQHTSVKEGYVEEVRYNSNSIGSFQVKLPNINICLNRTLWFFNVCTRFNIKTHFCKTLFHDWFVTHIDSLVHHRWYLCSYRSMFFAVLFIHNNYDCLGQNIASMIPIIPVRHYKIHYLSEIIILPLFCNMI